MKSLLIAVLLGAASALGQMKDLRTVNNLPVDLTPLDQWLLNPDGERPLKHWKEIQILNFEGRVAVWPKVHLLADGKEMEVLLANADKAESFLTSITNATARIHATRHWIEQADSNLEHAEARAELINTTTTASAYVPAEWYATVDDARRALQHMEAARDRLYAQVPKVTTDLAMFTGKTYGNLEVWDCGKRQTR